jgi:hypothetical protein
MELNTKKVKARQDQGLMSGSSGCQNFCRHQDKSVEILIIFFSIRILCDSYKTMGHVHSVQTQYHSSEVNHTTIPLKGTQFRNISLNSHHMEVCFDKSLDSIRSIYFPKVKSKVVTVLN